VVYTSTTMINTICRKWNESKNNWKTKLFWL